MVKMFGLEPAVYCLNPSCRLIFYLQTKIAKKKHFLLNMTIIFYSIKFSSISKVESPWITNHNNSWNTKCLCCIEKVKKAEFDCENVGKNVMEKHERRVIKSVLLWKHKLKIDFRFFCSNNPSSNARY